MPMVDDLIVYTNKSHANAWRRAKLAKKKRPDEPGHVSAFLHDELVGGLRRILQTHVKPGTLVSTRGIFTHQTPKVKPEGSLKSVEIADLMFVHIHHSLKSGARIDGRALLLQAKRTPEPKTGPLESGNEGTQFELYRDWPKFKGWTRLKASPNGTGYWNFKNNPAKWESAFAGAAYLTLYNEMAYSLPKATPQWGASLTACKSTTKFLASSNPANCTWSIAENKIPKTSLASDGVDCPTNFGAALSHFLSGTKGRKFRPGVLSGQDHWSIFVNLMLDESVAGSKKNYSYNSKNQKVTSAAREQIISFVALDLALEHNLAQARKDFRKKLWKSDFSVDGFKIVTHFGYQLEQLLLEAGGSPPFNKQIENRPHEGEHIPILLITTIGEDESPFLGLG